MKTCCVVVIGHVDHGKTSLVRALTGIETDRLPEEKTRGLSITPGFAHHSYPNGTLDFVDAPGHVDFVQAMVRGATGAQAALIVISVLDGIRAQTREHLQIADLLGIKTAVIAATKADLLTPAERSERLRSLQADLSQTPYGAAPIVLCSARSGDGIGALHAALAGLLSQPALVPPALHSFLPIDRVFSVAGRGTIVTGTLLGAPLSVEDNVTLQPLGRSVTLRGLQSRGVDRDRIDPGERMAANLRGVTVDEIDSGAVLSVPGFAAASLCVDARLTLRSGAGKGVKHMQELRVLFGTASEVAQVRLFRDGGRGLDFAQLRFKKPVACFAGQTAVLRSLTPAETIGGAVFLDPQAKPARQNDPARLDILTAADARDVTGLAGALATSGGGVTDLSILSRIARLGPQDTLATLGSAFVSLTPDQIASRETVQTVEQNMLAALAAYHRQHPLRRMAPQASVAVQSVPPVLSAYVEAALLADNKIRRQGAMIALAGHDPWAHMNDAQRTAIAQIEDSYRQMDLAGPVQANQPPGGESADLTELLLDAGSLVALRNVALKQTLICHKDVVAKAAEVLAAAFPPPQGFTTSQARTALGTSRRIIVPLLEHFDRIGVTTRTQDMRHMTANLVSPQEAPR